VFFLSPAFLTNSRGRRQLTSELASHFGLRLLSLQTASGPFSALQPLDVRLGGDRSEEAASLKELSAKAACASYGENARVCRLYYWAVSRWLAVCAQACWSWGALIGGVRHACVFSPGPKHCYRLQCSCLKKKLRNRRRCVCDVI